MLTDKYLHGVPDDSRAARSSSVSLSEDQLTPERLDQIRRLHALAQARGQSLAQLALAWVLKGPARDFRAGRCQPSRPAARLAGMPAQPRLQRRGTGED